MAGLLEEYGIDLTEVEAPSYDMPDDVYEFVVGNIYLKVGTDKKPDDSWILIDYLLGEEGKTKSEWFVLPRDASAPTEAELKKMGWYKQRIMQLGIAEEDVNTFEADEIIGKTGTLQLVTGNTGYQNIKNLRVSDDGENAFSEEKAEAPAKAPTKAPAKKPAATKAATVVENPFG